FEGWNDAADAATTAVRYLRDRWEARPFAEVDPEDFYDFSATRPQVRLTDGLTREIVWPANELSAASIPGTERDIIVLLGVEPGLHWRTFCTEVVGAATELGVEMMVTLGALLADLPSASMMTTDLEIASASYERQVSEVVESDEDVADYVHRLEQSADEDDDDIELPTGDALAAEFEKFLREREQPGE